MPSPQNSPSSSPKRVIFLECIRALAAVMVLFGHAFRKVDGIPQPHWLMLSLNWGVESVMLFFILSGFVTRISFERNPRRAFKDFILHRGIRIYPIFLIALIFSALVLYCSKGDFPIPKLLGHALFLYDFQGNIFDVISTNESLWSLSYEVLFSLLFSVSLLHRKFMYAWSAIASFCWITYALPYDQGWIRHFHEQLAFSCIWLFGYIIATYRTSLQFSQVFAFALFPTAMAFSRINFIDHNSDVYQLTGFSLLCLPLFSTFLPQKKRAHHPKLEAVLITLGATVTILGLFLMSSSTLPTKFILSGLSLSGVMVYGVWNMAKLHQLPFNINFKALSHLLVYIGSISYALYALHVPIILSTDYFLGDLLHLNPILILSISILLCFAIAHLVELIIQPMIYAKFKQFMQRKTYSSEKYS